MKLRPAVRLFAEAMEAKLRTHDGDRGRNVDGLDSSFCLDRLLQEIGELQFAYRRGMESSGYATENINPARATVQTEAVDVANFAMMLWHSMKPVQISGNKVLGP